MKANYYVMPALGSKKEIIVETVCEWFDVTWEQLGKKSRKREYVVPRQVCMYLCKKLTRASLPRIGREFGNKHHTTVLHSINKIEELRHQDRDLDRQLEIFLDAFK